ncbi:MAG TPA: sigma-70 family RNA polymerase sigma factor [Planctomycetaceae bacterium]|nr:sigma-70 family RNA polymerase sigma factor [Planctomycetaceae bacterium]
MPHDDRDIMQRVQAGQVELFEQLVVRYRPVLVRVAASKLDDLASAEDVVQETLLAAFSARDTYRPEFSFSTWLWTILLNGCRRHVKRRARQSPQAVHAAVEFGGSVQQIEHETGLSRLLAAERTERLHGLLRELPEPQADALRLRFFAGLTYPEIADAMQCSRNGARLRVQNGLETLARRLRADEVDL